jgi:hypothetical protein
MKEHFSGRDMTQEGNSCETMAESREHWVIWTGYRKNSPCKISVSVFKGTTLQATK